jgi:hypothetical protein
VVGVPEIVGTLKLAGSDVQYWPVADEPVALQISEFAGIKPIFASVTAPAARI